MPISSVPARPGPRRRVAVVTWMHDNQVGYLDFAYRIAALCEQHDVTLLTRRPLPEPELQVPATTVLLAPGRAGSAGLLAYWGKVARHLRSNPCDLVVHLCSHTAALANLPLGAPQVIYWNEHPSHYLGGRGGLRGAVAAALRALQYRGARAAPLVMPIGEAHRADLQAHGCREDRLRLLPMGVADTFGTTAPQPSAAHPPAGSPLRIVYTGSVHEDRGRDVMIDAVGLARQAGIDVRLTIIGAHAEQLRLCELRSAQRGVADAVRVLPRIAGGEIPGHLAQADFGICLWADKPYWRFNPPTKLFEYLVAGLPVMASNIRTHTAYLNDGGDGYIFDYDATALAATFSRAWCEQARWPAMRAAAQLQGRQYRWSAIQPRFLAELGAVSA